MSPDKTPLRLQPKARHSTAAQLFHTQRCFPAGLLVAALLEAKRREPRAPGQPSPGHRALGALSSPQCKAVCCHAARYSHLTAGPAPPPAPHGHPGPARGRREAASGRVKSGGGGAGRALRAVGRRGPAVRWHRSPGPAPCRAAPGEAPPRRAGAEGAVGSR